MTGRQLRYLENLKASPVKNVNTTSIMPASTPLEEWDKNWTEIGTLQGLTTHPVTSQECGQNKIQCTTIVCIMNNQRFEQFVHIFMYLFIYQPLLTLPAGSPSGPTPYPYINIEFQEYIRACVLHQRAKGVSGRAR